MNIFYNREDFFSLKNYFYVSYDVETSKTLREATWAIAVGQSTGNPLVRNAWETEELFANHSCIILDENLDKSKGKVSIAFPLANLGEGDGLSQLLCFIMGGQLDIDIIRHCRVTNIALTSPDFQYPKLGLNGLRDKTGVYGKPLLGAILKPKIIVNKQILVDMVNQVIDGGVNWIKEDEIMANPSCLTLEQRVDALAHVIPSNVAYHFCINGDYPDVMRRAAVVNSIGAGVHVNFWSGFGTYRSIRKLYPNMPIHFQKSGDKILTDASHRFGIDWNVLCDLVGRFTDSAHVGMIGGYGNDEEDTIYKAMKSLLYWSCVPALSCGLHPGMVESLTYKVGNDVLLNCGGAIHGHPQGSYAGAKAMRDAIDGNDSPEYQTAIAKWGKE